MDFLSGLHPLTNIILCIRVRPWRAKDSAAQFLSFKKFSDSAAIRFPYCFSIIYQIFQIEFQIGRKIVLFWGIMFLLVNNSIMMKYKKVGRIDDGCRIQGISVPAEIRFHFRLLYGWDRVLALIWFGHFETLTIGGRHWLPPCLLLFCGGHEGLHGIF